LAFGLLGYLNEVWNLYHLYVVLEHSAYVLGFAVTS